MDTYSIDLAISLLEKAINTTDMLNYCTDPLCIRKINKYILCRPDPDTDDYVCTQLYINITKTDIENI